MPKKNSKSKFLYQDYRRKIGNHTHWQDRKQGTQLEQDRCLQRLAARAGLHSDNQRRYQTSRVIVHLMAILSAIQISSAKPASTTRKSFYPTTSDSAQTYTSLRSFMSEVPTKSGNHQQRSVYSSLMTSNITRPYHGHNSILSESDVTIATVEDKIIIKTESEKVCAEFLDEQNFLIKIFLKDRHKMPQEPTPLNCLNQIVSYILEEDSYNRFNEVSRLLLQAYGYYGSKKEEYIDDEHMTKMITSYMNSVILNMTVEEWLLHAERQSLSNKNRSVIDQHLSLKHANVKTLLENNLRSPKKEGQLSTNAFIFYWNFVLKSTIPTLTMQLNIIDSADLNNLSITGMRWGFIHAGSLLLSDFGIDFDKYGLKEIEEIGLLLSVSIQEGAISPEILKYFRLPALLIYSKHNNSFDVSAMSEHDLQKVFIHYFKHIKNWQKKKNPFERLADLMYEWKTRTELAKEQFIRHNISDEFVTSYLNEHGEAIFEARKFEISKISDGMGNMIDKYEFRNHDVTLPNIDTVLLEQNRNLTETANEVDKLLLSAAFNSLSETEQQFIELSKVDRVRVQFNAQNSIRSVPLPPSARMAIVQNEKFVYRVPDHIDLLSCTQNDIERIYVLESSNRKTSYTLYRVDRDRQALLLLLDDFTIPSHDPDYELKVISHYTLKEQSDTSQKFIENIARYHSNKLFNVLHEKGYDKTTWESIKDFLLDSLPFYTCITESIKGNERAAIPACIFDIVSLVPFTGQAVLTSMRFSMALSKSTAVALSYGLQQSTIKAMLKQMNKQFIVRTPFVAEKVSTKVLQGLGVGFLRGVDPGFEPLARGGIKVIGEILNVIAYIPKRSAVMNNLVDALLSYKNKVSSTIQKNNPVNKSLFSPYHGKLLNVAVVGEEGGKQIWVQVDQETNQFFGQKFTLNADSQLEIMPVDMGHRNDPQKGLSSSGSYSSKQESYISDHEPWIDGVKSIGKSVVKQYLADTSYIQYLTKIPFHKKDSQVLVVSAHGGYLHSDAKSPPVMIPIDVTVKLLTPHNTMLLDPGLDEIVNAGENLKVYCTIKEGVIENIEFETQNGNPKWLYKDDYDPAAVENALGHKDGLQNYRHYRYEGESDSMIASVLRKNRKLANKGEAVLTDVLTLRKEIYSIGDTSLEETSVQKVLDLHKQGLLVNEVGASYKTIIFSHCRNCYQHLLKRTSVYATKREHLDSFLDPDSSPKGMESEPLIITVLHRENLSREFQIKHIAIGRIMYKTNDSALKHSQNSTVDSRYILHT